MQKKHLLAALVATSVFFVFSCGENVPNPLLKLKKEKKKEFSGAEYLAKDTIGFFRGAEFGDEEGTIQQMEDDSFLVFQSPDLLKYEYKLPKERRYQIEYTFKKNKLSSFKFDIFLADETEAETLTKDLKNWFSKKNGDGVSDMGIQAWPIDAKPDYEEAYLELKDESAEFGYGKVNITAYAIR